MGLENKNLYLKGALFESPVSGGEVGETNAKIIADQFHKLKFGDRFFFSHKKDDENHVPGLPSELRKQIFRYLGVMN